MPEIEEEIIFTTTTDESVFHTMMNGDTLVLNNLVLTKEKAATLSWLINHDSGVKLEVLIKLKS